MSRIISYVACLVVLSVSAPSFAQTLTATWQHDGVNTNGYHLYCGPTAPPTGMVANVDAAVRSVTFPGGAPGSTVYCVVKAFNAGGESGASMMTTTIVKSPTGTPKSNAVVNLKATITIP